MAQPRAHFQPDVSPSLFQTTSTRSATPRRVSSPFGVFRMRRIATLSLLAASLVGVDAWGQSRQGRILSLDEVYRLAATNNRRLKLSAAGIETARKGVEAARAAFLPRVFATVSVAYLGDALILDRDFGNARKAPTPHLGNGFSLEAAQIVYAGGSLSGGLEKAKLEERLAKLDREKEGREVRFLLAGLYLDIWKLRNQREVYRRGVEREEAILAQARIRHEAGAGLRNDVARHELRLQDLRLATDRLDNALGRMEDRLATQMGIPDSIAILPDTTLLAGVRKDSEFDGIRRPADSAPVDVRIAELRAGIAEREVAISKASMHPTVSVFAGENLSGPIVVEVPPIDKNLNTWHVGFSASWEVSSPLRAASSVRLAERRRASAVLASDLARENSDLAIRDALSSYREAFQEWRVREKGCEFARENHAVVAERYANGAALATEMIDADDARLDAELELENARIGTLFRKTNLERALGAL